MRNTIKSLFCFLIVICGISAHGQQWEYDDERRSQYLEHLLWTSVNDIFYGYDSTIYFITRHTPKKYKQNRKNKKHPKETLIHQIMSDGSFKFIARLDTYIYHPIIKKSNNKYYILQQDMYHERWNNTDYFGTCLVYSKDWNSEGEIKIVFPREEICGKYQSGFQNFEVVGDHLLLLTTAYNTGKQGKYLENALVQYNLKTGFKKSLFYSNATSHFENIEIRDLSQLGPYFRFKLYKRLGYEDNFFTDSIASLVITKDLEVLSSSSEIKKETVSFPRRGKNLNPSNMAYMNISRIDHLDSSNYRTTNRTLQYYSKHDKLQWYKKIGTFDGSSYKPLAAGKFIGSRYDNIVVFDSLGQEKIVQDSPKCSRCNIEEIYPLSKNKVLVLRKTYYEYPDVKERIYASVININ